MNSTDDGKKKENKKIEALRKLNFKPHGDLYKNVMFQAKDD